MYNLTPLTCTRLNRLPKRPTIWQGDRRAITPDLLQAFGYENELEANEASDCILWFDPEEGLRAVNIVPADAGPEAVVRALLQAMEQPQSSHTPCRPQRIQVRDREIQFFLRGALQAIDVAIDHVDTLPIVDELFASLHGSGGSVVPLPTEWKDRLYKAALEIWEVAPWNTLSDHHILTVTVNHWAVETLYVSVLGMAGMEYGILLYRSEQSLKQFREMALQEGRTRQQMEQSFLAQDCFFLNFELERDEEEVQPFPWLRSAPSHVEPSFGSIHPLEGLRQVLVAEEAAVITLALQGIAQFFRTHETALERVQFPTLQETYALPNFLEGDTLTITVATAPNLTQELEDLDAARPEGQDTNLLALNGESIPDGAIILVSQIPQVTLNGWALTQQISLPTALQEPSKVPGVIIQTTRPKAKALLATLEAAQGPTHLCLNPGLDAICGDAYLLALLRTGNGEFHLICEYSMEDEQDLHSIALWQKFEQQGNLGGILAIAAGATGNRRGNPSAKDIMGLFPVTIATPQSLNLMPLQLGFGVEWE